MMFQCKFINSNVCHFSRLSISEDKWYIGNPMLFDQFCSGPQTFVKNQVCLEKENNRKVTNNKRVSKGCWKSGMELDKNKDDCVPGLKWEKCIKEEGVIDWIKCCWWFDGTWKSTARFISDKSSFQELVEREEWLDLRGKERTGEEVSAGRSFSIKESPEME